MKKGMLDTTKGSNIIPGVNFIKELYPYYGEILRKFGNTEEFELIKIEFTEKLLIWAWAVPGSLTRRGEKSDFAKSFPLQSENKKQDCLGKK